MNLKGIAIAELNKKRNSLLVQAAAIQDVIDSFGVGSAAAPARKRSRKSKGGGDRMKAAHDALARKRAAKKAAQEVEAEDAAEAAKTAPDAKVANSTASLKQAASV